MARQLFTNNAISLLSAAIGPTDVALTVMTGYGDLYPQPGPDEYFLITLEDQSASRREIIRVTGRTGDTLTGLLRGQEDTTAQSWSAGTPEETLVDHRITAETMRLAMELPELSLGELTDVDFTAAPSIGDSLTWNGTAWTPTPPSAGTAWVNGANSPPVNIDPGWNLAVDTATYSNDNRTFKYLVTASMPTNGATMSFELLVVVTGLIGSSEAVSWNTYGRVGQRLQHLINVTLNTATSQLTLTFQNNEANLLRTRVTRIQHAS